MFSFSCIQISRQFPQVKALLPIWTQLAFKLVVDATSTAISTLSPARLASNATSIPTPGCAQWVGLLDPGLNSAATSFNNLKVDSSFSLTICNVFQCSGQLPIRGRGDKNRSYMSPLVDQ